MGIRRDSQIVPVSQNVTDFIKINPRNKEQKFAIDLLTRDDISKRELPKNTIGVVVTKISDNSPLIFSVGDVIVELQKEKVMNSNQFSD